MFGFKIIKMPLGIKLENQYATIPDTSRRGNKTGYEIIIGAG